MHPRQWRLSARRYRGGHSPPHWRHGSPEAALELTGPLVAWELLQLDQNVIVLVGIALLVHAPAGAVVGIIPVELPPECAVGVTQGPDLHVALQATRIGSVQKAVNGLRAPQSKPTARSATGPVRQRPDALLREALSPAGRHAPPNRLGLLQSMRASSPAPAIASRENCRRPHGSWPVGYACMEPWVDLGFTPGVA